MGGSPSTTTPSTSSLQRIALVWGYGHYGAAAGSSHDAGSPDHPALPDAATGMAIAVWIIHRRGGRGGGNPALPIAAPAVLAAAMLGARPAVIIGLVLAGLVAYSTAVSGRENT